MAPMEENRSTLRVIEQAIDERREAERTVEQVGLVLTELCLLLGGATKEIRVPRATQLQATKFALQVKTEKEYRVLTLTAHEAPKPTRKRKAKS